jgi:hypothetical protein
MPVSLPNLPKPTYHKLFRSLELFLVEAAGKDPSYNLTLLALYYADKLSREGVKRDGKKTTGLRKDGRTPEFQHQLEIALLLTTLPNLRYPAETLTVALLHDVLEDYVGQEEYILKTFGESVYRRAQILNKYHPDGTEKDKALYFDECANDPVTSIVKGGDNSHNQSTMHGVFPLAKVFHHIKRCADYILPMLKTGRRAFPDQNEAYENLKFILRNQCLLAVEILNAAGFEPDEDIAQPVEATA